MRCRPTQIVLSLQWRRIGFYGLCVHEPTSLSRNYGACVLPSQLDAWLAGGPTSESLAPTGGLVGCWPAYPPIPESCAGPARRAKSVSIQQQPATRAFQVAGCFSIRVWQECSGLASPPTSASQRSMLMHGPATSWRGRGALLK